MFIAHFLLIAKNICGRYINLKYKTKYMYMQVFKAKENLEFNNILNSDCLIVLNLVALRNIFSFKLLENVLLLFQLFLSEHKHHISPKKQLIYVNCYVINQLQSNKLKMKLFAPSLKLYIFKVNKKLMKKFNRNQYELSIQTSDSSIALIFHILR